MIHNDLLLKLGLTEHELHGLLRNYKRLIESLNAHQRLVLRLSHPTMEEALASLGPDVTEEDLLRLFGTDDHGSPIIICHFAHAEPSRPVTPSTET